MATALNSTLNNVDINSIINIIKPMLPYLGPLGAAAGAFSTGLIGSAIFLSGATFLLSSGALSFVFGAGTILATMPTLIAAVPILISAVSSGLLL